MTHAPPLGLTARGEIRRVIDGDTLEADLAFLGISIKFRLLDCWAPEPGTPEGDAASEFMRSLVSPGSPIVVHIPTIEVKTLRHLLTFDRILAEIWKINDNQSLNERMIYGGHATAERNR